LPPRNIEAYPIAVDITKDADRKSCGPFRLREGSGEQSYGQKAAKPKRITEMNNEHVYLLVKLAGLPPI
jgi:hypothetical protein